MSNGSWTPQEEEELLVDYISNRVIERASGASEEECLFNLPRDRYFIGNLRSAANLDTPSELQNKLAPLAFGAEFLIRPEDRVVKIQTSVRWACYYRVFPSYQQQCSFTRQQSQAEASEQEIGEENGIDLEEDDEERAAGRELEEEHTDAQEERRYQRRDTLCMRFRKIPCQAVGDVILQKGATGEWEIDSLDLEQSLEREVQRSMSIALDDTERLRTNNLDIDKRINVPNEVLESEDDYNRFLDELGREIDLSWRWELQTEIVAHEGAEFLFSLNLTNVSPMSHTSFTRDNFVFDTSIEFQSMGCSVLPFTLELAPRGFRYDRDMWGRGFNSSVERLSDSHYQTTHTPVYRQMRYTTRTDPSAPFDRLAEDPIPVLRRIHQAMLDSIEEWDAAEAEYQQNFGDRWGSQFRSEFENDKRRFLSEMERFEDGLRLISSESDIRVAFQLMNETFRRAGRHPLPSKRKREWRLFQIVFIVTQIPGIFGLTQSDQPNAMRERRTVDIIYFPTGGGKTEAYLGVLTFHCFFDRLRGKSAGVTAWTRFPLRLLTLQQTQRIADIIGMAELVRLEQSDPRLSGDDIQGFAVGYFVGKEATPNELVDVSMIPERWRRAEDIVNWSRAQDESERQQWKRVITCPSCHTNSIRVDLDADTVSILHRCMNRNCRFPDGIVPVYVIDNEIYRYLPSVVVGTIDKLAGLGNQRKFSLIFGQLTGRCTIHGYYNGICCQKECRDAGRLRKQIPRGISGPTLFIQDELHLLREGLGTFDGHYETFTQELLRNFGQVCPLKIIASSATIEAFERQVEHLYGRMQQEARIFPSPGSILGSSFYAETQDYPQRIFLGIIPHNKTIFNATLELLQYYHEVLQNLQRLPNGRGNPYGGRISPNSSEWLTLIDNYMTSITYFLATRDLSSIRTDLDSAVNTELEQNNYRPIEIVEMTGGTSTSSVTDILERVERTCPSPGESPDAILATSMISHGVDVDRFNTMIFYGIPRQNAEYIQASSRIGRRHVGLVITCLHPARERDQSHYIYFTKYHEFLGQLIEPVAINRWSRFSIQRTLPGLFMGVLLQVIANRSGESNPNRFYMLDFVRRQISSGELRANDFVPLLEEAYRVTSPTDPIEEAFRDEILLRVQQFLDWITGAVGHTFVSDALIPPPMRSLRDVDEAVEIELNDILGW